MEVWYDEWRLGDDPDTKFLVGDRLTLDVMPLEQGEQLAKWVDENAAGEVQHELFDSDDADPFLTVRGLISGLREYRVWWRSEDDQRIVDSAALFPIPSTRGRYERRSLGGEVQAYVLTIAEDDPISENEIAALAAAYVLVNKRQQRWAALEASGAPWPADPYNMGD